MQKPVLILATVVITVAAFAGGLWAANRSGLISIGSAKPTGSVQTAKAGGDLCPHTIKAEDCPFCTPALIESKGFCKEHAVPEALCHLCNASIIPAFKAKGDWCSEHNAPESLCPICSPGAGLKYLKTADVHAPAKQASEALVEGACPHGAERGQCPFCTPKLMVDRGFCKEHNTPEAFCALCNKSLVPVLQAAGDWCAEHSQSETFCMTCSTASKVSTYGEKCPHELAPAACPFCTPELIVSKGFCGGHGVPEAFCHTCNPSIIPAFKVRGDWCTEHSAPKSLCPVCSPAFASVKKTTAAENSASSAGIELVRSLKLPLEAELGLTVCETEKMQVRLAPDMAARIGLEVFKVQPREFAEVHTFNAQIDYNRDKLAQLASRVHGVIQQVNKQVGDSVEKGEVLAVIESVSIGNARSELRQAQALVDSRAKDQAREKSLLEKGVSTQKDLLAAEAALTEARISVSRARQELRNLGLGDDEIGADSGSRMSLTAPFDGVVIERRATAGEVVDTQVPLFRIVDPKTMWAWIDINEKAISRIREGLPVFFTPDGMAGERFTGKIAWVSTEVDPQSRILRARVELPNSEGRLRANMFGRAEVRVRDGEPALVVPKDAVQWDGCCHIVFARQSDTIYLPRKVRLGYELADAYEIAGGLKAGEEVVTKGGFLLKTEIMKGSIGAGCCEVHPGK